MSAHPLDPLSDGRIPPGGRDPSARSRRRRPLALRVDRVEGAGQETVREFEPGEPIIREALVVCWNRDGGAAYQGGRVTDRRRAYSAGRPQPGVQPNLTADEWHECDMLCGKTHV